ncbi:SusE domain-containing protein [Sinomicrobium soli]|uniref:SusE domain-containing protein n=1 Tax=Sinomicrobium sp. N-1-3-6 TaxID=2219864 RepID=UPI000DCBDF40|nr:SusE domain-containing protein [Sinomicrobium sp. N-1-3-6]RAV30556.1 hypothetical protein DN748_03405 [Sinomicrobium sp. N-1-3-6]
MKTTYIKGLFIALVVCLAACKDDDTLSHVEVTPVNSLYAPEDNLSVRLEGKGSLFFEWEAAKAEDNGVVLYDVLFDTEDGDFSDPVYITPSEGKGFERTLTLAYADLARMAEMAGIVPDSKGKLKWTVHSSRGIDIVSSGISRVLEIERPEEIYIPQQLFLTGTATEGGDALEDALSFKKTGDTAFEIYTRLIPGSYRLTDAVSGTPNAFFVDGNNLEKDGTADFDGEEGVYRLRVDFEDNSVAVARVEEIGLWFAPNSEFQFSLPYAGNGTWKAESEHIVFRQEDWGRDERYKFRMILTIDGNSTEEWFGSVNKDNSRPDNAGDAYWNMVPVDNSEWDYCFKFATAVDEKDASVEIIFNNTVDEYTHVVTPL